MEPTVLYDGSLGWKFSFTACWTFCRGEPTLDGRGACTLGRPQHLATNKGAEREWGPQQEDVEPRQITDIDDFSAHHCLKLKVHKRCHQGHQNARNILVMVWRVQTVRRSSILGLTRQHGRPHAGCSFCSFTVQFPYMQLSNILKLFRLICTLRLLTLYCGKAFILCQIAV